MQGTAEAEGRLLGKPASHSPWPRQPPQQPPKHSPSLAPSLQHPSLPLGPLAALEALEAFASRDASGINKAAQVRLRNVEVRPPLSHTRAHTHTQSRLSGEGSSPASP